MRSIFQMHFNGELMTPQTRPPRYPKVPRREGVRWMLR
jgi:hypothetical protein